MDTGLIVTFAGVAVAGLAAILGVWMERDRNAPLTWGFVFSGLIVVATGVEMVHAMSATAEQNEIDAQLASVLEGMAELAAKGNNPALEQFVGAELAVQARANPDVVTRMEESVAAKGGDPASITKKASQGRRSAAGLSKEPPKPGEKPKLSAAMETHAIATGSPIAAALTPSIAPAELGEEVLGDALEGSTEAAEAAIAGAKEAGAAAVEDVLSGGTDAVDAGKAAAEAAAADAKAAADKAAADATKAAADAEAAARAEADKAKAEAEAAAAEAAAQKKAAEEAAAKQKAEAEKKKKQAEKQKKEAEKKTKDAAGKAKDVFGG